MKSFGGFSTYATVAFGLLFVLIPPSYADPALWDSSNGGNNHYYEAILTSNLITWEDAKDEAEAMGGYLVTIISDEENTFIESLFSENLSFFDDQGRNVDSGPWTGASATTTYSGD